MSKSFNEARIKEKAREIARLPFDDIIRMGDPYKIFCLIETKIKDLVIDEINTARTWTLRNDPIVKELVEAFKIIAKDAWHKGKCSCPVCNAKQALESLGLKGDNK